MFEKIYQCIAYAHESRLVVLAVFVCLYASYTVVTLLQRMTGHATDRVRWMTITAIASGIGIWATHFIAMLAFQSGLPVSYAFVPTMGSLVVAVIMSAFALKIALSGDSPRIRLAAGLVLGGGIGAMHYLGMSGLRLPARMSYDPTLLTFSFAIGIVGAWLAFILIRKGTRFGQQVNAALMLTLAICGLHFFGMGALKIVPDPTVAVAHGVLSEDVLAFGVSLATLMILSFSLAGAILDRHMAERRLLEARRLRGLANAALEGIVLLNEAGAIVDANHSFLGLSGRRLTTLQGMPFTVCFRNLTFGTGVRTAGYVGDAVLIGAGGQEIPTEIFFRPVQDRTDAKHVAIVRDIRERRAAEQQIDYLSSHDTVTGLANRMALTDRLEHSLTVARKTGRKIALYFVDIDTFKDVNARYGQKGGDELLKGVADRLLETVRDVDTVARLSADQFCILQEDIDNTEAADLLALRLRRNMVAPFIVGDHLLTVTASTGITIFPDDAERAEDLLLRAEVAVKRAKTEGRGRYCFFEHSIDRKLEERRALKQDLMGALGRHELFLVYQPQFRTADSELVGFEVLLRWHHPEKGMISPAEFIPLAEETGVINDISIWLLNEACREAASWTVPLGLAINLSPVQLLEEGLVDLIRRITTRHGLRTERLELEVTEGVLIADEARALEVLNALKAQGMRLAMDDFGTGYSSLSYLQNFPFDKLKIDRAFIMQMEERPQSAAIVRGMIGLGHGIGIPVLAEGVETEAQLAMLKAEGCDEVQGFLLGRPERIGTWAAQVSPMGQRDQGA